MPSSSNTRERPRLEPKTDKGTLSAADSLRLHWPEYLMEAGEAGLYLFSACTVATLLWDPASPAHQSFTARGAAEFRSRATQIVRRDGEDAGCRDVRLNICHTTFSLIRRPQT